MTEEQKKRIRQAKGNDNSFDGMAIHYHFLVPILKSGFKTITEIEMLTEEDFIKRIDDTYAGKYEGRGGRCARGLKQLGVVFRDDAI